MFHSWDLAGDRQTDKHTHSLRINIIDGFDYFSNFLFIVDIECCTWLNKSAKSSKVQSAIAGLVMSKLALSWNETPDSVILL